MPSSESKRLSQQSNNLCTQSDVLVRDSDELIKYAKTLIQKLRDARARPEHSLGTELRFGKVKKTRTRTLIPKKNR
jgi:hypothetical protein